MNSIRKHAVEASCPTEFNSFEGLIPLPLILGETFLMDLLAVEANLIASYYAEILVNANIDEFIRYSKGFINNVCPQSAVERGYDVFLLACILAEQRDHT